MTAKYLKTQEILNLFNTKILPTYKLMVYLDNKSAQYIQKFQQYKLRILLVVLLDGEDKKINQKEMCNGVYYFNMKDHLNKATKFTKLCFELEPKAMKVKDKEMTYYNKSIMNISDKEFQTLEQLSQKLVPEARHEMKDINVDI